MVTPLFVESHIFYSSIVHHGNGTEETVRWLTPHVLLSYYYYYLIIITIIIIIIIIIVIIMKVRQTFSDNGSGFSQSFSMNYKPWYGEEDQNNVLFVSVHGYGPRERGLEHLMPTAAFYPG